MYTKLYQIFKDNKEFCPINSMKEVTRYIDDLDRFLDSITESSLAKKEALEAICEIFQDHKDRTYE
jgi:hypothetical protein